MNRRIPCCCVALAFLTGCQQPAKDDPPPDARRPALKSEAELRAERSLLASSGAVTPTSGPAYVSAEKKPAPPATRPASRDSLAGSIRSDVLLVNDAAITVDEVLYPLRARIVEARQAQTRRAQIEKLQRLIRTQVQQDVGAMLLYAVASAKLEDQQKHAIEEAVNRTLQERVSRDFGGSFARLNRELAEYGLTEKQLRNRLERELVVRQYTREMLLPRVALRRDELIEYFKANAEKFSTPETREFLLIEAPFARFLPDGLPWPSATSQQQARAKLDAVRHIRAAHEALRARPFADVAREFSRGPHAEQGGLFGEVGKPLQAPYETASKQVFAFSSGQFTEPLETPTGWIIAGCGKIAPAVHKTFAEAQDQIRDELTDERFNQLASDYVIRLAEKATISALDAFVVTALDRASGENWPRASTTAEPRP
ncbi:MAG: peptidylprolyl isomerase [Phycisphaerae bacterium]